MTKRFIIALILASVVGATLTASVGCTPTGYHTPDYVDRDKSATGWGASAGLPKIFDKGSTITVKLNGCIAVLNVNPDNAVLRTTDGTWQALATIGREAAKRTHYDPKETHKQRCRHWMGLVKQADAARRQQNNPSKQRPGYKERRDPPPSDRWRQRN